jgi:hypothetical protein
MLDEFEGAAPQVYETCYRDVAELFAAGPAASAEQKTANTFNYIFAMMMANHPDAEKEKAAFLSKAASDPKAWIYHGVLDAFDRKRALREIFGRCIDIISISRYFFPFMEKEVRQRFQQVKLYAKMTMQTKSPGFKKSQRISKPEKRSFNSKRRILSKAKWQQQLESLKDFANNVRYKGKPEHKRFPGDFCLSPPADQRSNKSLCDADPIISRVIFTKNTALKLL